MGSGALIFNGGNLIPSANRTAANTLENDIELRADAIIRGDTAGAGTRAARFSGKLIDSGGNLTIANNGTTDGVLDLILSGGDYTFSRNVVIGIDGETGLAQLSLFNINTDDPVTYSGNISGYGSLSRSASTAGTGGTSILSGANTYSGDTALNRGFIGFGSDSTGPAGAPTSGPIGTGNMTIANDSSVGFFAHGGARTVGNNMTVNTSLLKIIGENNLTLTGTINLGTTTKTFEVSNTGLTTIAGAITGTGGLTKTGEATLEVSGAASYTGDTTVGEGTLRFTTSTPDSPIFAVSSGATLDLSGQTLTLGSGRKVTGGGTIANADIVLSSGSSISPGSSPGTMTTDDQTWNGGAAYLWEINDVSAGEGAGWDLVNIIGSLTIGATSGDKFIIDVTSLTLANTAGEVNNFLNTGSYEWRIATASEGITGFDADKFDVQTGNFSYPGELGVFSITQNDGGIILNYAPVPEPSTLVLGALGGIGLFLGYIRRRRS